MTRLSMGQLTSRSLLLLTLLLTTGCGGEPLAVDQPLLSVTDILGAGDLSGFSRAEQPIEIRLPADHASHPTFRSEWWYFTGNLTGADGGRFGYQFTIFRLATSPKPWQSRSAWATNQVFLAHAALTDPLERSFHSYERMSRGALGLAGVNSEPFAAWVDGWSVTSGAKRCPLCLDLVLQVAADDFTLELNLDSTGPPVFHGDRGFSRKNAAGSSASYYYSFTRMQTKGSLKRQQETIALTGTSWFDHEWSTSALIPDQSGWDWFSLQLSDQSELMLFRLRNRTDPGLDYRSGTLVRADGTTRALGADEIHLRVDSHWTSRNTGVSYPLGWSIDIPSSDIHLVVEPILSQQEIDLSFRYWEGAVRAQGTTVSGAVTGRGYLELTGY